MVVLYHASGSIFTKYFVGERPVGRVFDFGYAGVDFFFVLSGFIMLHVHRRGVGICGVYTYEVAETKVTQVMDFARQHQHPLQCTLEKD